MDKNNLYEELELMYRSKLVKPFPYSDIRRIYKDFEQEFSMITEDKKFLSADFNTYCSNIAGGISYVLDGKFKAIPQWQIEVLQFDFFDFFSQYSFLKGRISQYKEFNEEYTNNEKARHLLLEYLSK